MLGFRALLIVLLVIFAFTDTRTQTADFPATTIARSEVRAGPGHTYEIVGALVPGNEVVITERNRIGNWLYIEAETDVSGWVRIGVLRYDDLTMSDLPTTDLPDADVSGFNNEDIIRLYETPIIPEIDVDRLRGVNIRGQMRGNQGDVVVKVGDSNSAQDYYLTIISTGNYDLGPYDILRDTVDFFGNHIGTNEIAAQVGLNAFSLFDPIWSPANDCQPDETPLACDYRLNQPGIAVIMFGANDLRVLNSTQYEEQLTAIVEYTLDQGIIPVLSTFIAPRDDERWFQVIRFNNILIDIAESFSIPVVNLWSAARGLPNYGIGADRVHMTVSGGSMDLSEGHESTFGVTLQNLIVLHTLDVIRRDVLGG